MGDWLVQNKDLAEALSYWATFLGIVVAVLAGLLALTKHYLDLREARWNQATTLYFDFINCAFENPDLNNNFWRNRDESDLTAKVRYDYFIAKFLWASDDILSNQTCDDDWRNSIKIVVGEHVSYFSSPEFQKESHVYCAPLLRIVEDVVRHNRVDANA